MRIDDFRLTFAWTQPVLDLLTGELAAAAVASPQLLIREPYIEWFEATRKAPRDPAAPAPPWPAHGDQGFWIRYLDTDPSLQEISGSIAWREVVPARVPRPVAVTAGLVDARTYTEGFVHPWGLTLLVNVVSSCGWDDLVALAGHVVDWRSDSFFVLDGRPASLDEVAMRGLADLRRVTFGAGEGPAALPEPFSVFTPVRGSGSKPDLDSARPEVHRLLHAAATFSPTWDWDTPDPVARARVARRKHQPPEHVVFGTTRGRSVWGPAYLGQAASKHTLSCQHRNLVFASAMTQSLLEFAAATIALGAENMKGDHDALARRAMAALGGMYLGSRYRTGSVKKQVDASGRLDHVNALRAHLGLNGL